MTQPQALQPPRGFPLVSARSMHDACEDIESFAQGFDLYPSQLCSVSAETIYVWAEQLEAAARKMNAIARRREAQGE